MISRKSSKRAIPSLTRSRSLTPRRAKQRERRILSALAGGAGKVVEPIFCSLKGLFDASGLRKQPLFL